MTCEGRALVTEIQDRLIELYVRSKVRSHFSYTTESRGKNLLNGLRNLLDDLERGKGRLAIKLTDMGNTSAETAPPVEDQPASSSLGQPGAGTQSRKNSRGKSGCDAALSRRRHRAGHRAARRDRRFRDVAWTDNTLFDFIKQSYLLRARWLQNAVRDVEGIDERTARKVDFYTRQFVDATAPSNFLMTNPEVLRATIATAPGRASSVLPLPDSVTFPTGVPSCRGK